MALIAVWVSLALDFRLASPETAASVVSFLAVTFDLIGSISELTIASTITGILYPEPFLLIMLM